VLEAIVVLEVVETESDILLCRADGTTALFEFVPAWVSELVASSTIPGVVVEAAGGR
jgi:hypothetical protein